MEIQKAQQKKRLLHLMPFWWRITKLEKKRKEKPNMRYFERLLFLEREKEFTLFLLVCQSFVWYVYPWNYLVFAFRCFEKVTVSLSSINNLKPQDCDKNCLFYGHDLIFIFGLYFGYINDWNNMMKKKMKIAEQHSEKKNSLFLHIQSDICFAACAGKPNEYKI